MKIVFFLLALFFLFSVTQTYGFSGLTTTFKVFAVPLPQSTSWYAMNITGTPNKGTILTLNGSADIVFSFYNNIGDASIPTGTVNLTFYVLQNSAAYRVLVSTPNATFGDLFRPQWLWLNFTVNPTLGWNKVVFTLPARTLLFHSFLVIDIIRTTAGVTKILLGNSTYPATLTIDPEWSLPEPQTPIQTPTFGNFPVLIGMGLIVLSFPIYIYAKYLQRQNRLRVRRRAAN